ncbi:MAG: zinc ABC transporter substrate-binding protein [Treponema sp.]|nr:zinc ABC transporter substrate-binding protein [Treponema sp.]
MKIYQKADKKFPKLTLSIIFKFVIFLLSIFLLVSCNKKNTNSSYSIVTTNFPCYDFTKEVIGNPEIIKMLIKPGLELHSYDPTPQDILAINNCDVFIYIGGESDEWVEKILSGIDTKNKNILRLIDYVDVFCDDEHHHESHDHDNIEHCHIHEIDEHIWTSPSNAKKMVKAIENNLSQVFPELAQDFVANAENFYRNIDEIIFDIHAIVEKAPQKFIVMGDRFPFKYFVDEFGLESASAFSGCSTAVEASPQTIKNLIDTVKEKKLKTVFHIELSNQKIAKAIAEECGVGITLLHSAQNVSKDEFENGISYITLMRDNAKRLKENLY